MAPSVVKILSSHFAKFAAKRVASKSTKKTRHAQPQSAHPFINDDIKMGRRGLPNDDGMMMIIIGEFMNNVLRMPSFFCA